MAFMVQISADSPSSGTFIYVAGGRWVWRSTMLTDPARPRQVGAYPTDSSAIRFRIAGTHACVDDTCRNVDIGTLRDPTNPQHGFAGDRI